MRRVTSATRGDVLSIACYGACVGFLLAAALVAVTGWPPPVPALLFLICGLAAEFAGDRGWLA